jgi:nucleotide-binding universal stress UspA family protein
VERFTTQQARVVVGVDGSAGSLAALRWALAQARRTVARVEAVCAWQDPSTFGLALGAAPAMMDAGQVSAAAEKALAEAVAEAIGPAADGDVTVVTRVIEGHPAQVLTQAADGAQLLVVGRRGHTALIEMALAGMALGSVSRYCVQHAPCPVVVVPD